MCLQTEDICNTLQTSITLHWACRLLWVDWWLALGRPLKRTAPVPSHTAPPPASPNALGNRNHASTRFHTLPPGSPLISSPASFQPICQSQGLRLTQNYRLQREREWRSRRGRRRRRKLSCQAWCPSSVVSKCAWRLSPGRGLWECDKVLAYHCILQSGLSSTNIMERG